MKMIIKEYISMLKESKELDALLPDLLLSMGIEPISKPQVGVRQYGVDITAFGKDEDGIEKVFLLTVKQGDVGRRDWNSGEQAIRPSLDEIKDAYIPTYLGPEYQDLPKKIILCTGGDLKQEIQLNWNGYISGSEIEYDFWGGDKLALLIEEYLFTEQIIPAELRAKLRKTIALIGDTDYDLRDYFSLIDEILLKSDLANQKPQQIHKTLRLLHLCLNIVFYWAKNESNLRPALLSAERTVLNIWEFIRSNDLYKKNKIREITEQIYGTFYQIQNEYFVKIQPYCHIENGLSMYGRHFIQESILLFEQLGIISNIGNTNIIDGISTQNETMVANASIVCETIKKLIQNHKTLLNPVYDEHIIDIVQALFLLQQFNEIKFIDEWVHDLLEHIHFAYDVYGKYFPIDTDSFEDLVEVNLSETIGKEELVRTSTLLAILSQWCIHLGLIENYKLLKHIVEKTFVNTTLQIWYPDSQTESFMFKMNAGYKSGFGEAPIILTDEITLMQSRVEKVFEKTIKIDDLSCVQHQMTSLLFIASRHFRMPPFPHIWKT